jgi:transposase
LLSRAHFSDEVTALCDWQKHECDLRGTLHPAQRSPSGFFLILAANSTRRLERFPAELNRGFPIVCERASLAALIRGSGGTKSMPKPYSDDLRERVIEAVVAGASRREAAESFSLSASSAVRWLQRWRDTGNARAKLSGGSTSPLEEHVEWLLALVAEQPDLTLDEIVAAMRKQRIPGSRTAVWRFFERHNVTVKKKPARDGARTGGRGAGAAALDSQARPA